MHGEYEDEAMLAFIKALALAEARRMIVERETGDGLPVSPGRFATDLVRRQARDGPAAPSNLRFNVCDVG